MNKTQRIEELETELSNLKKEAIQDLLRKKADIEKQLKDLGWTGKTPRVRRKKKSAASK